MRGSLPRLSSCRRGEFALRQHNTDSVRNLPFLHTHSVFPHVSRFPGFIFPCLGVHPVQEVSPEQHRGACLQVDYSLISRSISDRLAIPSPLCLSNCSCFFPFWRLYAGSRCCFAFNTHTQGTTRGYRGGNTTKHVLSSIQP